MKFRAGWILLLLFAACLVRAEQFGSVSVEMVPPMLQDTGKTGYFVREFRLENRGTEPARIWMRLRANTWLPFSAERSVLLPPGTVRNVQLFFPRAVDSSKKYYLMGYFSGVQLDLVINGRGVRHSLSPGGGGTHDRVVLVSGSLPFEEYSKVLMDSYSSKAEVSTVPVAQWGREMFDYAGLGSVWISSEDRLPPEVETTLMRWVFGGGTLVVCVPPDAAWPEGEAPESDVKEICHGWGKRILCRPIPPGGLIREKPAEPEETSEESEESSAGGGNFQEEDAPKYEFTPGLAYLNNLYTSGSGCEMRDASRISEVIALEIPTIPLHWLFFVMLVFVILIGPVNYFVLKKLRREMLLLATTPAISLLFCLLVIGFITVAEGWFSRAKVSGITLLDQENRLAATRVMLGVYAPIPPGDGFRFDSGDMLNFCGAGEIDLALNEGQHFRSGLLQPRIPLYAVIERVTPQREQLRITREKGGISVVNGLGVKLSGLGVVDDEGRLFVTDEPVEPGARVELKLTSFRTGRSETNWAELLNRFESSAAPEENFIRRNVREFARGYYIALAEEPLFYTPGFEPDQFTANHLVFGRYSFSGEE